MQDKTIKLEKSKRIFFKELLDEKVTKKDLEFAKLCDEAGKQFCKELDEQVKAGLLHSYKVGEIKIKEYKNV